MTSIEITPQQARAIAVWCAGRGNDERVTLEPASPSLRRWAPGDIVAKRGDDWAAISATGAFKAECRERSEPQQKARRFAFIAPEAQVRAKVGMRLAMELAANGAGDAEHELGDELIRSLHGADEPLLYTATVKFPAPSDRAADPGAPVCVEIPELDGSGDLFVLRQEELEPTASPQPRS